MSEILKRIKKDLREAMKKEIQLKKPNEYSELSQATQMELALSIKEVARSIISMFPEIRVKPDQATDKDTISLLKKYVFMEKTRLLFTEKHLTESDVTGLSPKQLNSLYKDKIKELGESIEDMKVMTAMGYLPKQLPLATDIEIKEWISENLNLADFKNKMQAMGPIMAHFGERVDGKGVKQILINI